MLPTSSLYLKVSDGVVRYFWFPFSDDLSNTWMHSFILIIVDSKGDEMTKPTAKSGEAIPLPDIKRVLQKKAIEDSTKVEEEENKMQQVRISRKDKAAYARVSYFHYSVLFLFYYCGASLMLFFFVSYWNNNLMLMPTIHSLKNSSTTLSVQF
jgi:hypothetical protein